MVILTMGPNYKGVIYTHLTFAGFQEAQSKATCSRPSTKQLATAGDRGDCHCNATSLVSKFFSATVTIIDVSFNICHCLS